jgi:hypothetical protein
MSKVAIVICWQPGTEAMVTAGLSSIARHTHPDLYEVVLVSAAKTKPSFLFLNDVQFPLESLQPLNLEPPDGKESSRLHGWMLDEVIPGKLVKENEFLLTLDSDCFPVADGWLDDLIKMLDGAMLSGILHPWAPPPADLPASKVEYRVRSQHCWQSTHVACQLIRLSDYRRLHDKGCRFNSGDDTGLLIPKMVKADGGKVDGFKVSRCPVVWEGDLNPEFNRYSCLVYGDKVYHHGGFSRSRVSQDDATFRDSFGWCEDLVLWGRGAEFLLNDRFGYKFKLDQEERVAQEKMQRLFGLKTHRMPG